MNSSKDQCWSEEFDAKYLLVLVMSPILQAPVEPKQWLLLVLLPISSNLEKKLKLTEKVNW